MIDNFVKVRIILPNGDTRTGKLDLGKTNAQLESDILSRYELSPSRHCVREFHREPDNSLKYGSIVVIDTVDGF